MKNLQWTDLELLDRGIESYPEFIITDEVLLDVDKASSKGNQGNSSTPLKRKRWCKSNIPGAHLAGICKRNICCCIILGFLLNDNVEQK